MIATRPREFGVYLGGIVCLVIPWLLNVSWGPSPSVTTAIASALACVLLLIVKGGMLSTRASTLSAVLPSVCAQGWLAASLLSSAIALCQFFDIAEHWEPWVSASQGVAYANLRQRNQFASLTVIGFAALLFGVNRQRFAGKLWPVCAILSVALLCAANAASASRTGFVALVLVCAGVICWRASTKRDAKRIALLALPLYGVAAVTLPWLAGHTGPGWNAFSRLAEGDAVCSSRLTLWSNVLHLIAQNPWTGWGWGELDYAHFITLFPGERFCAILDNAHNLPLHLAVEWGIPAAVALCGGAVWWVLRRSPWADTDPARQMAWSVLAIILLHSMLEFPLWYGPFQMAFVLCIVILWPQRALGIAAQQFTQKNLFAPTLITFVATALIAFVAYVGWDYYRISQIFLPPDQRAAVYRDDTLNKIRGSWLFRGQVQFAELSTTPLTLQNAAFQFELAKQCLHFSPEPLVVQRLIDSASLLGYADDVHFYRLRFKAAFPSEYAQWASKTD